MLTVAHWRAALALIAAVAALESVQAAVQETLTVGTADGPRKLIMVTPDAAAPALSPRPLVLLLHGHGGTADNAMGHGLRPSPLSAWRAIVDREGIVLAVLQGSSGGDGKPGWNDCRGTAPGNPHTDDVAFARDAIQDVARRVPIDLTRIYAMGMSNGAMMSQRLALELQPRLAAFAAVSGSLAADSVCSAPGNPVSALLVFGTDDPVVPYAGGEVKILGRPRGSVLSVEQNLAFWLRVDALDGASTPKNTNQIAHLAAGVDPTSASQAVYGADTKQPQVSLLRIAGGGHIEPSLQYHYGTLYESLVGKQSRDLESAELAWQFFKDKRTGAAKH